MTSRRDILYGSLLALGVRVGAGAATRSTFRGVRIGIQSRSFQDRRLDDAIAAMSGIGFDLCEMSGVHLQPEARAAELRKWRLNVDLDHFAKVGEKLRRAGIEPEFLRIGLLEWRAQQRAGVMRKPLGRRSPVVRAGRISAPIRRRRRVAASNE